jgi:hypothetical protein
VTAGGREDAAPITVIELDPSPAVIHRAHVLPEETDDSDLLPPVARHARLPRSTDIGGGNHLAQGHDRDRGAPRGERAGEDRRLILEMPRQNPRLILQRATNPVTIAA